MRATFASSNVIGVICFVPTRGNHIHQKHMSHQDPDDSGKFTEPGLVTHIIQLVIPVAQTGDGANSHSLHIATTCIDAMDTPTTTSSHISLSSDPETDDDTPFWVLFDMKRPLSDPDADDNIRFCPHNKMAEDPETTGGSPEY